MVYLIGDDEINDESLVFHGIIGDSYICFQCQVDLKHFRQLSENRVSRRLNFEVNSIALLLLLPLKLLFFSFGFLAGPLTGDFADHCEIFSLSMHL